jgi:hypothetical protein
MQTCECNNTLLSNTPVQHFPSILWFQFASNGALQNILIMGKSKFSTSTMMMLNHTNPRYMRENFSARRYAQIENLSRAIAIKFIICRIQRI